MKKSFLILTVLVLAGFVSLKAQDSVDVTFQVDMSVKVLESFFDPNTEVVTVPGGFNNWLNEPPANTTKVMDDSDGDTIYTKTIRVGANATYEYKYNIGLGWDGKDETNNRSVTIGASDTTLPVVFFNDDSVVNLTGDGNILFQVDMSVMSEVGIFDNVNDSVQVRGSFNNWNDSDPARSKMNQDPIDPDLYFLNVTFDDEPIGNEEAYKFYVKLADTNDIWTDGWERPLSQGGGNRDVIFEANPSQDAGLVFYDDVDEEWVIESGVNLSATFRVDMRPAMDPVLQPLPFNPAEDTVYWVNNQPAFTRTQGWVDTDEMRVLILTDLDGDSIYTGTLDITAPSFNSFEYLYAFVDVSEGNAWTSEPFGFGDFSYRVRFIGQDAPRSFPVNPWTMPVDTWTNSETKTDQETDPYTSLTDVDDQEPILADRYDLAQNYPNPFNPATVIRFNIPQSDFVTLKVYNLIGQEVATLINNELPAGTHEYHFNASSLSTGVYFYTITAGDFTATKKMMLIK
ncbi:MAG: hypothetical protein Kow0098_03880 [Ignavibacteriaceae bacterium]